jgi:hypothetical protein
MILGGYDQARTLGKVGVFDRVISNNDSGSNAFLVDVFLGAETGEFPFKNLHETTSFFRAASADPARADLARFQGGPPGSVSVLLAPEWPNMGLPSSLCEAIAEHLPVAIDSNLGVYIWDESSPQFEQVVRSSAFVGFVFSDKTKENVTIKVPFQLLNLTLGTGGASKPRRQYFPCPPVKFVSDAWLYPGRAFFQGKRPPRSIFRSLI